MVSVNWPVWASAVSMKNRTSGSVAITATARSLAVLGVSDISPAGSAIATGVGWAAAGAGAEPELLDPEPELAAGAGAAAEPVSESEEEAGAAAGAAGAAAPESVWEPDVDSSAVPQATNAASTKNKLTKISALSLGITTGMLPNLLRCVDGAFGGSHSRPPMSLSRRLWLACASASPDPPGGLNLRKYAL